VIAAVGALLDEAHSLLHFSLPFFPPPSIAHRTIAISSCVYCPPSHLISPQSSRARFGLRALVARCHRSTRRRSRQAFSFLHHSRPTASSNSINLPSCPSTHRLRKVRLTLQIRAISRQASLVPLRLALQQPCRRLLTASTEAHSSQRWFRIPSWEEIPLTSARETLATSAIVHRRKPTLKIACWASPTCTWMSARSTFFAELVRLPFTRLQHQTSSRSLASHLRAVLFLIGDLAWHGELDHSTAFFFSCFANNKLQRLD